MAKYAVVNHDQVITDVIEWDGVSALSTPTGYAVIQYDAAVQGEIFVYQTSGTENILPPPTPLDQAMTALTIGISLTCTGDESLNGLYICDNQTLNQINSVVTYIILNDSFPGNASTLDWTDTSGTTHTFANVNLFKSFASAMTTFAAAVLAYGNSNGTIGSIPSNEIMIS